jgi:tagatose-6-phosphate ketose/aldose isomerase
MSTPGEFTHQEIYQQPELWADSFERVRRHKLSFASDVPAVITGAGTSAYAGEAVAAAWHCARGIATTDLLLEDDLPFQDRGLLVSLARSGNSRESAAVVERIQRLRPAVQHFAITCNPEGKLAGMPGVDVLLLDPRTNDRSRAMTSSYSNMVLAGMCVRRAGDLGTPLEAICRRAGKSLPGMDQQAREMAARQVSRAIFLGSGPLYVLAREAGLKVLEMTSGRVSVLMETYLGLRHGPMRYLRPDSLVVCFLSSDPRRLRYERDLLEELRIKKLGRIVAIGSTSSLPESLYDDAVESNAPELPDNLRAPFDIVFAQLLGYHLGLECGVNPDILAPDGFVLPVVPGIQIYPE